MADYIYLLEHRLSAAQRSALRMVREVARAKNLTVFLVGGAVRDLTSGSPVRDLDVVVLGNALKLRKDIEKMGAIVEGENEAGQALFLRFPGSVRMEIGSTLSVTFPKPGKPVVKPATILDDLRRRDFTANAMALSLNEGSYGLLMDPLNGVADIENRELRLVSNYGFIDDPIRMIRATRLMARLGWAMDEKTQARYENSKNDEHISAMSDFQRGYELEEIVHEEDPFRVLKRLETEGWMKYLAPYWNSSKVNILELERLREAQTQLQMQSVHPDPAAANFPILTARLTPKEIATLKASFPRQGFVAEIDALEGDAKDLTAQLTGKGVVLPSQTWRLLMSARPEAVLQVAFSTKNAALQNKFKSFYNDWPQARQKMPYTLMQEMRIVPELSGYEDLLEKLFFELMDGNLSTPEEMKAFLEPYSPPAPPPPVSMRRLRAAKKEAKPAKSRSKKSAKAEEKAVEGAAGEEAETAPIPVPAPVPEMKVVKVAKKEVFAAPPAKPVAKVQAKPAVKLPPPSAKKVAVKAAPSSPPAKGKKPLAAKGVAAKPVGKVVAKPAPSRNPAAKPTTVKAAAKKKSMAKPLKVADHPAKKVAVKVIARPVAKKKALKAPAKPAGKIAPAGKAALAAKSKGKVVPAKGTKKR
jgi:tRNA nucleotidyltransferase (CCA-adding enzyme)